MCAHLLRLGRVRPTRLVLTISRVGHHEDTSHEASSSVGRDAGADFLAVSCGDDDRICRKTLISSVFDSRFPVVPGAGSVRPAASAPLSGSSSADLRQAYRAAMWIRTPRTRYGPADVGRYRRRGYPYRLQRRRESFPPATSCCAGRVGRDRSIRTLSTRGTELRPAYLPLDPASRTT